MTENRAIRRPVTCPYCDSTDTELFSLYGNSLLSSQYYCHTCHTVFDTVRFDDEIREEEKEVTE
jgi:ring-1,2-phenylacetyl-CoA epoxidase subunit PaaD